MCKIPDCDITTDEETNAVVVGKAEMDNEMTEFQGRYAMYDSILICGEIDTGEWKTQIVPDEEHEVSSMVEIVTLLGNLPMNRFIVANITQDIELVDMFFPDDGFVITHQRVLLDGSRGSNRSQISLEDSLGQVFYLIFNGRLEIANVDVIINHCQLDEARKFTVEGDNRLPTEEQLRDPAYGSEWGYFVPIEIINSPPTPDSRTTLRNTRVVCKICGPLSFTSYGMALKKSNITKFRDLAPDTDGNAISESFPARYKADDGNLVERTSEKIITFKYLEVVSPFDAFATSVALELVNVTLECEQIEEEDRGSGHDIAEAQSSSGLYLNVHLGVPFLVACVVFTLV